MLKAKLTDPRTQVRFWRFLVVGGGAAGVQFAVLWLLKQHLPAGWAFTLSFAFSTATHYTLNRFWALPSERRDSGQQLAEYLLTVALSYVINLGTFKFCQALLGLGVMLAAACAIPPSTLVVFLLLNFRVFRAGGGTGGASG